MKSFKLSSALRGYARRFSTSHLPNATLALSQYTPRGALPSFRSFTSLRDATQNNSTPSKTEILKAIDVIRKKQIRKFNFSIASNASLGDAIDMLCKERVSSLIVHDHSSHEIAGMFTARDILRKIGQATHKGDSLKFPVTDVMTPVSKMVYCDPEDNLRKCRMIMSELKIRHLPVLSERKVLGIVTMNDLSDMTYDAAELGGKEAYIRNVSDRRGLPSGATVFEPAEKNKITTRTLIPVIGSAALPHPFKTADGVACNQQNHLTDYSTDITLSEDAHFVANLSWPTPHSNTVTFLGIADGVGSWRKVGIDPRKFPQRFMHCAFQYVNSLAPKPMATGANSFVNPPRPIDVLNYAWETVRSEKIVGSSTACIATLEHELNQFTFSNVGDNGIVVLRHIDANVAGYLRDKRIPRHMRSSDLKIAFVSQQQLRSFNLPYQLGFTNVDDKPNTFETPRDADTGSIPVIPGDIIILGTDGLYDNLELDEICSIAVEWEKESFKGKETQNLSVKDIPPSLVKDLASRLCARAREVSLDATRDGPFALLAKENDIMWGGGMPDDCTIIVLVVTSPEAQPESSEDID